MKVFKIKYLFYVTFFTIFSCTNNTTSEIDNKDEQFLSPYKTVQSEEICQISVPKYFEKINDINPKAIIQYGYIEVEDTTKKNYIGDEIYVIVLVDYKFELEQLLGDSVQVGIEEFNKMCQENLEMILDDFSAEYEHPKTQTENNVKSIHNEFLGRLDEYLVYYQIGVFETDKGFYQILTWTLQEYMNKHKEEMLKMTTSFKEL
ncbi:MAG TPA: hypothetical protein EYG85_07905 [Crocinitomix sp.]|nr:hypothetical protein [Crocinitomix sp.]